MSGLDAASFLLDLPAYIDNFVKTCRALKEYKDLDDTHKALMTRAILNSERLQHLTSFIREPAAYSQYTQDYIAQLVRQAKLSMDRTSKVVNDWKERLGIKEEITGPRTWRLAPSFSGCFRKNNTETQEEKSSYLRERLAEAEYMIIGKLEILSSMESLEHYLNILNFAILTSDCLSVSLEPANDTPDNLQFVLRAKRRADSKIAISWIDRAALRPLSDIDADMATGIFRVTSGSYSGCIVDPRNVWHYSCQGMDDTAWEETKNIARLFAEDAGVPDHLLSASVGILPSCGYTELDRSLHAIVFRLPPGISPPRTLRSLLVEGKIKHSLRDRVDFAIKLATCVLVVHSLGLVHKSIRPDSIIVTEAAFGEPKTLYPYRLGIPYLLAFDSSRTSTGQTMKHVFSGPDGELWQMLYRHPRHFPDRQYKYEMRDDIYSLGICLLEIALWKSLFWWDQSDESFEGSRDVLDLSNSQCREVAEALGKPSNDNIMWLRQYLLVDAAEEMIPPIMGDLFRDVIVACLTFGTPLNIPRNGALQSSFEMRPNHSPDNQSIHFVRDVLAKLSSIKLA